VAAAQTRVLLFRTWPSWAALALQPPAAALYRSESSSGRLAMAAPTLRQCLLLLLAVAAVQAAVLPLVSSACLVAANFPSTFTS
jgi:hypothetical protein